MGNTTYFWPLCTTFYNLHHPDFCLFSISAMFFFLMMQHFVGVGVRAGYDTAFSSEVVGLPASFGDELSAEYPFKCVCGLSYKDSPAVGECKPVKPVAICFALKREKPAVIS